MKLLAPTIRCRGAWHGLAAACLATWYGAGAFAQMLAPNPNPGTEDAPPSRMSVPVRVVPAPNGNVLERTDLPSAALAGDRTSRSRSELQQGRVRIVTAPNGGQVLELIDVAPPPVEGKSKLPALVVRSNAAGARVLELPYETPEAKRQEPQRQVVDIRAESSLAAVPREPEPDTLYRIVRP